MNRYIVINGEYDDMSYYVVSADDMMQAVDKLTAYLSNLPKDDQPYKIRPLAIGIFDNAAQIVRIV